MLFIFSTIVLSQLKTVVFLHLCLIHALLLIFHLETSLLRNITEMFQNIIKTPIRCHVTQHNGIQHNDTQHKVVICDIQHNDIQHSTLCHYAGYCAECIYCYAECHYAECHYAECHYAECR